MKDPYDQGLQNVQSMVALANGGLFGRGLGRSTVKWGYLPYAWTDFIFAVIGEEFGILGAMTVVLLFLSLAGIGTYIASQARDRFSMLLAVGITTWLSIQALMNIAAVVRLMPITGIPLPFISFGGSAMVVNLTAVGLLLNVARHPASSAPNRSATPTR
jgi:cell division protein FtsW